MKAMILAAGLGERLHPLTTDRSKSALSVLNRPIILSSLYYLAKSGIHEVVINRHRHADSIALALLRTQRSVIPTRPRSSGPPGASGAPGIVLPTARFS